MPSESSIRTWGSLGSGTGETIAWLRKSGQCAGTGTSGGGDWISGTSLGNGPQPRHTVSSQNPRQMPTVYWPLTVRDRVHHWIHGISQTGTLEGRSPEARKSDLAYGICCSNSGSEVL